MADERYWVVHRRTRISIYAGATDHVVLIVRHPNDLHGVAEAEARITSEAKARGNVALFKDVWVTRDWGEGEAARLRAQAGRLADDYRPRPLPR